MDEKEWATQKRKRVSNRGISVGNSLEAGECRITPSLCLDRAFLLHSFVDVLRKARHAHQGSGRVENQLDVRLKPGLLDRQGSVQVRALWLWAQA